MDIGLMFKLGGIWKKFCKQHPKFPAFMQAVQKNGVPVDTIIDVKFTYPNGTVAETNIKVTQDDINAIEELKKLQGKQK